MQNQKRILICPLDWGLGHATRCIPIIRLLLQKNAEVIIAADGRALSLLKQEFPQLTFIPFKGYSINYSEKMPMTLKMLLSIPKLLKGIKEEHKQLQQIIDEHRIDAVISDNRYGCWSKKVTSIFITHQLMIKAPFAEKLLHKKVLGYLKKYTECWVPDLEGKENLSGDLAHKYQLLNNTFFVGPLSRFSKPEHTEANHKYDVMAIVSGPEPQRSVFEKLVVAELKKNKTKALIVCGKTEQEQQTKTIEQLEIVNHLSAIEMQHAILQSKLIIARSGYSTIMDLSVLGKKAIFIPTPGQTEQEYLANRLSENKIAPCQTQMAFNLSLLLEESKHYKGFSPFNHSNVLEKRIDLLCD